MYELNNLSSQNVKPNMIS